MSPSEIFRSSKVNVGVCGHCSQRNETDAKFCGGCGQPLWESCEACETLAPIGRRFCGGCGGSLHEQFAKRLEQSEEQIRHGIRLANQHRYDEALSVVRRHQNPTDYRFDKLAKQAKQVLEKIVSARDRWFAKRDVAMDASKHAFAIQDYQRVVQLLEKIPENLLDSAAKERLATSKTANDQLHHCRTELKEALANHDYAVAGMALNRLLTMEPDKPQYQKLAAKVSKALVESAEHQLQHGRYRAGIECLESIPLSMQDEKTNQMIERAGDVLWMVRQFAREPFAFPRLGRLAQRLAKLAPEDARSKQLVQELVQAVRQPAPDPRQHVALWRGSDASWLGSPVRILAFPQRIRAESRGSLQKQPGAFSVAIGLALQGLGLGRVQEAVHVPKRKGLKKILQRLVRSECVGIDLGSTAVRAVHLQLSGDGKVTMVNCWQEAFEQPLCRAGLDTKLSQIRRRGLERIAERIAGVDAPAWVNLPGRDVLGRFILLPPIEDKEARALLNQEIDRQFPIGADELMIMRWLQSEPGLDGNSRCGALIACRDHVVLERLALFTDVGIQPAAVQCDPVALVNFASFEFQEYFSEAGSRPPGVALVDAGASAVTFLAVSDTAFWFRSLDGGGEDLSAQLAQKTLMSYEQAEQCKRDPAMLSAPASQFASIEEHCTATGKRLQQTFKDAREFMPSFEAGSVWTFGGASLMHGWISRALGRDA